MHLQLAGVFCALSLVVAGCASQTGVVPNGQGGYLIAKQAATGFPGLGIWPRLIEQRIFDVLALTVLFKQIIKGLNRERV
jgi:hypothetical protein